MPTLPGPDDSMALPVLLFSKPHVLSLTPKLAGFTNAIADPCLKVCLSVPHFAQNGPENRQKPHPVQA